MAQRKRKGNKGVEKRTNRSPVVLRTILDEGIVTPDVYVSLCDALVTEGYKVLREKGYSVQLSDFKNPLICVSSRSGGDDYIGTVIFVGGHNKRDHDHLVLYFFVDSTEFSFTLDRMAPLPVV